MMATGSRATARGVPCLWQVLLQVARPHSLISAVPGPVDPPPPQEDRLSMTAAQAEQARLRAEQEAAQVGAAALGVAGDWRCWHAGRVHLLL